MLDCGVALEGGGARGAYHIGAMKLLLEKGYNITGVVGTSIGAINGAIIAQGDFEIGYDLWKNIKYSDIFYIDEDRISKALKRNINLDIVKYFSKKISHMVKNGGIDTKKMYEFLYKYIDEEKIRNSSVLYGLVTYCLCDEEVCEIYLNDIPKGQLIDYIMASARLPVFKQEILNGKYYTDGGICNKCPVNMLVEKDFKDIFVIRTSPTDKLKELDKLSIKNDVNIVMIKPKNNLPNIFSFESKTSNSLMKLGYYDAFKKIDNLEGIDYYIKPIKEEIILKSLYDYNENALNKIYKLLNINESDSKKNLFEKVFPIIFKKKGFNEVDTYKEVVYTLVEYVAMQENIDRFKVYELSELLDLVKVKIRYKGKNNIDEVIYRFVKNFILK